MSMTHIAFSPKSIRAALVRVMDAGLVPFVAGSPGVGKSDIVRSIAEQYDLKLIDIRLSQCDPTDLMGFPNVQGAKARYVPMDTFPIVGDDLPLKDDGQTPYKGWLIFLDELPSASKAVQAAAYKLILDKMVGQYDLHPNVAIMSAGNKMTDRAIVNSMGTAIQSRLVHLELAVNHKEWMDWAAAADVDSRIMGFLSYKTTLLHSFSPDHQDRTFPCPRTWEFASKLSKGRDIGLDDLPLFAGVVGQGAAQEYVTFAELWQSLPRIEEIIRSPQTVAIAQEVSTQFAIASYVADHITETNADQVVIFLNRLPVEMQVVSYRIAATRKPALAANQNVYGALQKLASYLN